MRWKHRCCCKHWHSVHSIGHVLQSEMKRYRWMRRKSVDSTHIFIQFASEFQCYTEVISVVPQDISVKAIHRENFLIQVTVIHFLFLGLYILLKIKWTFWALPDSMKLRENQAKSLSWNLVPRPISILRSPGITAYSRCHDAIWHHCSDNNNGEHTARPVSQIPKCTSTKSQNAPFCNRNVHMCAHFCYKMVHRGIFVMHCGICEMALFNP